MHGNWGEGGVGGELWGIDGGAVQYAQPNPCFIVHLTGPHHPPAKIKYEAHTLKRSWR